MQSIERFYKERFDALEARLEESTALGDVRRSAIESLEKLGIPNKKDEQWKYTDIRSVMARNLEPLLTLPSNGNALTSAEQWRIEGLEAHVLVFVNGMLNEHLSSVGSLPEGVVVSNIGKAASTHAELLERHLGAYARHDTDPFSAMNTAFTVDGAFVYVPDGVALDKPVEVVSVTHGANAGVVHVRHLYVFENASTGNVVETYGSTGREGFFTNSISEFFVGERAKVAHYRVEADNDASTHVCGTYAEQVDSSHFTTVTLTLDGKLVRNNVRIRPNAEQCETHLGGLYLLRGNQHVDNNTLVDHAKPHCFSNEIYKGILDDQSSSAFSGMLLVRPDSQQTNAFQQNKTILLTDDASSYSKPQLEIYADDVRCSHGATTGTVDPEALFYLRVRGIGKERARNMLLHAFVNDVLELISHEPIRNHVLSVLDDRLSD